MTVAELIARLKKFDQDALVMRFADMEGFEKCDLIMKEVMIRRRPKRNVGNGRGEFISAGTKPKSRARRVVGVIVV